jgi:hypothetical protein
LRRSPDLLAICHRANAMFTPVEDELLIAWTASIATKAQQSLIILEPASLEWTEDNATEYKALDTNLNCPLVRCAKGVVWVGWLVGGGGSV